MTRILLLSVIAAVCINLEAQSQDLTPSQIVNNPELVHSLLRPLNPDYQNHGKFEIDPYIGLVGDFGGSCLVDLTPLRGLPFRVLDLKGLQVSDLTALKGMSLVVLGLEETAVSDLHALAGMKLSRLYLNSTAISDLTPLAGMPITELMLVETRVRELRPLRGMPLQQLWLSNTPVLDISPLAGCPLVSLTLEGTNVSDLRPLSKTSSLEQLHIGGTRVSDLTPLKSMKLKRLIFTPSNVKIGLGIIRRMKSLTELGTTLNNLMSPGQFWALYDQGRLR